MTCIYELKEDGNMKKIAEYTESARESLRNYIMQYVNNDWNTCEYPYVVNGMRMSKHGWFFDDFTNHRVLGAYEVA